MAHLTNRQFIIGGVPRLVLAGEIHYFRLKREDWTDRIRKAKEAGCNAIASYIPWLYHEEVEGDIDLVGRKTPEHDLGAFMDLCHASGLWFIPRPGPFVMGEVKNEGIPDWIYAKCPDAIPITWGGKKATSKTLSYLDPDYLSYVDRWYAAVMPVIADRLEPKGGVISVQLDNEVGMLQCWTEEADLSDSVLCEFTEWVQKHRSSEYAKLAYPFDIGDPAARAAALRDGGFPTSRFFHSDYTEFTRYRFARYIAFLRTSAEKHGVRDVPFIVNLHGSGGGRATAFPIGISQNYPSYTQAEGYWGSSDHYLGDLTRENAQDLYFLNAFMASVNRPEQPLSSVEFEAGSGDYGETGARRYSGAATDFKARLSIVQGNRMLNHYLLAGGINPTLENPRGDGNDRVGTTGERHGFAAPISPEGRLDPTYHALAETNHTLMAVADHLAVMEEEHDDVALGFIPDYYSTDVKRPGPMQQLAAKLEVARGFLEGLTRGMMDLGLSFPAVNLQAAIPPRTKCICLAASEVLHEDIQRRLLAFVEAGGQLFLYGRVPMEDMEGRPCSLLADRLGIKSQPMLHGSPEFFPSLKGLGFAKDEPEVRVWQVQPFEADKHSPFLQLLQRNSFSGSVFALGRGKVVLATAELKNHRPLWKGIFTELGVAAKVTHDAELGGIVLSRIRDKQGQRFISLINLDSEDKELTILEGGRSLFPQRVFLAGRTAKLLPLGVKVGPHKIISSTAEVMRASGQSVTFRRSQVQETVIIQGQVTIDRDAGAVVSHSSTSIIQLHPGLGGSEIRLG